MNHDLRFGNITSSQIHRVVGAPKTKETYLKQIRYERKMKTILSKDGNARSLVWGKFCEKRVYDLLPLEYRLTSQNTLTHKEFDYWRGSPDGVTTDLVFDIKCPYTRLSFCELAEICINENIELFKKEYPEYYWQLVSNAILTNKKLAELVVYLPNQSELVDIREMAMHCDDLELITKIYWIANGIDEDIPHQPNESDYKNLYQFKFEVLESEKEFLTEKIKAIEL